MNRIPTIKLARIAAIAVVLVLCFCFSWRSFSGHAMDLKSSNTVVLTPFDGTSQYGDITVSKKAYVGNDLVDEVCGGQIVTFKYTVRNNYSFTPGNNVPLYFMNITDSDPALGDIDGTVNGVTVPPLTTVTYTKTKTIAVGEVSMSTMTVTGNYSAANNPGDAVTATDIWTVTGLNCNVRIEKTVNGGAPSAGQSFSFEVRTGATTSSVGTTVATATANSGNGGTVNIGPLSVNTNYQFCETNILPGWTSSLSSQPGAFVPNSSNGGDNSTVCVNFSTNTADDIVFAVDNQSPPTPVADARTIGYWKNWSSCSKGNQTAVLDYVLSTFGSAPAAVPNPLPSPLPPINPGVNIGMLQVDTCSEAVNILNKSTVGGVKKASNAAYNMAAQLLAERLNVQANADPRCIVPYANEAQQILVTIGFNGSTTPSYTTAQGNRMNTLATYLDNYNNGVANLCPLP